MKGLVFNINKITFCKKFPDIYLPSRIKTGLSFWHREYLTVLGKYVAKLLNF